MKNKLPWSAFFAGIGMVLLILDGKTALLGARTGVTLCITAVIPALFPFLVLSPLIQSASFGFLMPLGRLCRIPRGAEQLLIPAFLGGYPVGAQSVTDAYRAGRLERSSAEKMLAFCNNAGPSFLFGILAPLFPDPRAAWVLWAIHLGSAILVAKLFPSDTAPAASGPARQTSLSDAMNHALRVMGTICGWVVLFRVVIAFLTRWVFFLLPIEIQAMLTGMLELTNGCFQLPMVESAELRFLLGTGMLSLGGLCVTMQTRSVTEGLSLRFYFMGKGLQWVFSLLLCGCLLRRGLFLIITPLFYFVLAHKKRAGIPAPAGI